MSTLKTPDNAMVPEPVASPGRKVKRPQTRERKTAKSHVARQAKKRTMPKKPKDANRKRIAKFFLKRLNEDNCERYGISKVEIFRMREAWREAARGPR